MCIRDSFSIARQAQVQIAHAGLSTKEALEESIDRERQCVLAIESVYTYLHRMEVIVRPQWHHEFPLFAHSSLEPLEQNRWLADLRFVSEVRNKVIEHAPENLDFHSNWGQGLNLSDPMDFRLWILHPEAIDRIANDDDVSLCLLYTSPSPRDATLSRMPSSA